MRAFFFALFLVAPLAAQTLNPTERKIADAVDAGTPGAIALLETLVNQNSGTMNFKGVEAVAELLRPRFEALGFRVRWIPTPQTGRAGHLVAEREGTRGKRLLLIGHLDTVFEADNPFQKFERNGDSAIGPGVNDIKGGDVVILLALEAMQKAGALEGTTIRVVFTGDEEKPGRPLAESRRALTEAAKGSDLALEFENTAREDGHDLASVSRRSSSTWSLQVTGKAAHSSGVFSGGTGDGAIYELARILSAFHDQLREPNLTYNVGLVLGGNQVDFDAKRMTGSASGKDNIVPQTALAEGDIRTLSDEQTQRVRGRMKQIVANHLPQTGAEIRFEDGYPAMAPTAGNLAILEQLNAVNRALGYEEMPTLDPLRRGAGDISFIASIIPGLAGLGVVGEGGHTSLETVDLARLPVVTKRAALLMYRLTRSTR